MWCFGFGVFSFDVVCWNFSHSAVRPAHAGNRKIADVFALGGRLAILARHLN